MRGYSHLESKAPTSKALLVKIRFEGKGSRRICLAAGGSSAVKVAHVTCHSLVLRGLWELINGAMESF